jgi:hypothetical protein
MNRHEILVAEPAHRNGGVSGSARRFRTYAHHLYKAYKARRYPKSERFISPSALPPSSVSTRSPQVRLPLDPYLLGVKPLRDARIETGNWEDLVPFY